MQGTEDLTDNDQQNEVKKRKQQEVNEVIKELKRIKSAGDIIQHMREKLKQEEYSLIRRVWSEKDMPERWRNALICPVLKVGEG